MKHQMSRGEFIRLGGLTLAGALVSDVALANNFFSGNNTAKVDVELMKKLLLNNDAKVKSILDKGLMDANSKLSNFRPLAGAITVMTASISHSGSAYYKSKVLAEKLNQLMDMLLKNQYSDGTLDAGGNRQSPPDTAFILEYICSAAAVLNEAKQKDLVGLTNKMKTFIVNAGEAMATGGVHTPNHRWVVSAALANINSLYPDAKYVRRID